MAIDIGTLEKMYFDACERQGILPNKAVAGALVKAKIRKARQEMLALIISLDSLKDVDFHPLLYLFKEIETSEVNAVDVVNRSFCALQGDHVSTLLHTVTKKLRVVDICDISFGKDFLLYVLRTRYHEIISSRDLSRRGLSCEVLIMRASHFRKLNMVGKFERIHTLNLDFSASLTSFREGCFSCMPNLRILSLCETRIGNLWTTAAALAKLPSLIELRFQKLISSLDGSFPTASSQVGVSSDFGHRDSSPRIESPSPDEEVLTHSFLHTHVEDMNPHDIGRFIRITNGDSSDDSDVDFSDSNEEFGSTEYFFPNSSPFFPSSSPGWNELFDWQNEISSGTLDMEDEDPSSYGSVPSYNASTSAPKKYIFRDSSPICYEKHYRDYMMASLPNLDVLDNLPIETVDRARAKDTFARHFEYLPYNRRNNMSVVRTLQKREIRENFTSSNAKSKHFYSRSLSAARMGSSSWPALRPLSITRSVLGGSERGKVRPRQFEYHPSDPSLMVFGTMDGEVVVINHESENVISYIPSFGAMNSVLGLCWLRKHPSKLIAGSDNGLLRLYDIKNMPETIRGSYGGRSCTTYDEFDQLTSVHVNSTDELFLASGYSRSVALYDISSGKCIQVFPDMHREHINVVKFSNHSPSLFATSSFDQDVKMWDLRQNPTHPCYTATSSRGNVMVCFSPDDHYLLVSAIDNEVKQLLAVDGRLHLDFGITPTGSPQNYTRSYYMSGKDYVISGSCDEHVIRVCCARTGRRLRDITLEGKGSQASMFVQSLRGDPFRDFNMSVLAAYVRPNSNSEIVKVNLLSSNSHEKRCSHPPQSLSVHGMGG